MGADHSIRANSAEATRRSCRTVEGDKSGQRGAYFAENAINCRGNLFCTADGSEGNQGNKQRIFDQVLTVFPVQKYLKPHVQADEQLIHVLPQVVESVTRVIVTIRKH